MQLRNIVYKEVEYIVLIDGEILDKDILNDNLEYFLSKNLLINFKSEFKVNFVGEFLTPSNNYISLPKNFEISKRSVEYTIKILNEYRNLKRNNKILISNFSFTSSKNGINSEIYYYDKLKNFFLDFISYEFMYPSKMNKIFSTKSINNMTIDVVKTEMMINIIGNGVVYNTKDINSNFPIRNIYYSTIKDLSKKYGSVSDIQKIESMEKFLKDRNFNFEYQEIREDVINIIKQGNVDFKQECVKRLLIDYFSNKTIQNKFTINVFYTHQFEYVWEFICRQVLQHNQSIKNSIIWNEPDNKQSFPDIFSYYLNKIIIADSKYYKNINSDFIKELYEYNTCQNNKYPMIVLVPSNKTKFFETRRHISGNTHFELILIEISLYDIVEDIQSKKHNLLSIIHNIMSEKSSRW